MAYELNDDDLYSDRGRELAPWTLPYIVAMILLTIFMEILRPLPEVEELQR